MNAGELLAPASSLGAPAPYAILVVLKVLGFTLHVIPMNLWYVGLLIALVLQMRGSEPARLWSSRLIKQMPLFIAAGINFGIVPLLFLQVTCYRVFYPATILMAWPWMSIIPMLGIAYTGVYAYVAGLKRGHIAAWQRAAGWTAALLFLVMGFLFTHGMSLMTHVEAWSGMWRHSNVDGAVLGTALDRSDPTVWPRWLLMIGLALTTTAVHVVVDTGLFAARDDTRSRLWAARFAARLQGLGLLWFAIAATWYVFGTWKPEIRSTMLSGALVPLTALTALSPGVVLALVWAQRRGVTRRGAWATGAAQFVCVALNATSRQVVQNLELRPVLNVAAEPVHPQWSPLVLFVLCFLAGIGVIGWIVRQVVHAPRGATPEVRDMARPKP